MAFDLEHITLGDDTPTPIELNEIQQTALVGLQQQGDIRRRFQAELELYPSFGRFSAIYERACGENASDDNKEAWRQNLGEAAEDVLVILALSPAVEETEVLARDTAGLTYAYLALERRKRKVGEVRLSEELLKSAGVDLFELEAPFRSVIAEQFMANDVEERHAHSILGPFTPIRDFWPYLTPIIWDRYIQPKATLLRTKLIAKGMELPELNADGKYGDDDKLIIKPRLGSID